MHTQTQNSENAEPITQTPPVSRLQSPSEIPQEERLRISEILRRSGPIPELRDLAHELLEGKTVELDSIEPLISSLKTGNLRECRAATIAAWILGQAELTLMQQRVAAESLNRLLADKPLNPGVWVLGSCAMWPLMPVALIVAVIAAYRNRGKQAVRAEALTALCKIGDPGCISVITGLVVGSMGKETELRSQVRLAFPQFVASLTPEYYGRLPSQTVPDLCTLLRDPYGNISTAALEAIAKVGDGRALFPVRQLAEMGNHPLHARASQILPILEARHAKETNHQTLLRATNAPIEPPSTLLRPAAAGECTNSEVLLRPVIEDP